MITVVKRSREQIAEYYPELFEDVFESGQGAHLPGFAFIVCRRGANIGFVSAHAHDARTAYIQYAGLVKAERNRNTLTVFKRVVKMLHQDFEGITMAIENDNSAALRVVLSCGFRVNGVRVSNDGCVFVELLKVKGE